MRNYFNYICGNVSSIYQVKYTRLIMIDYINKIVINLYIVSRLNINNYIYGEQVYIKKQIEIAERDVTTYNMHQNKWNSNKHASKLVK